jgi:hypothetical protein
MKTKLSIMGLLLVGLLTMGVAASAASAAIKYEWKVGEKPLKVGTAREIKMKNKSTEDGGKGLFRILGGFDGIGFELTSSKVSFKPATMLLGGKPGTIEGYLVFEGLTVASPKHCAVDGGKAETTLLRGEIVESAESSGGTVKGTGKPLILFENIDGPKEVFLPLLFENAAGSELECSFNKYFFNTFGKLLAEPAPNLTEPKVGQLLWDTTATSRFSYYITSAGAHESGSELSAGASHWEFAGEPEIELVSKEKFGAF